MIWCIGCYYWMMNRAAAWLCPETSLLQPAGMIYLDSGYLKNHGVVLQSSMWGRSCLLCFPVLSWSTSLKEDGTEKASVEQEKKAGVKGTGAEDSSVCKALPFPLVVGACRGT